jgi:hypothetical protein
VRPGWAGCKKETSAGRIEETAVGPALSKGAPMPFTNQINNYRLGLFSFATFFALAVIFFPLKSDAQMTMGANFWNLGWGSAVGGAGPEYNYFAANVNWPATTNPWNPTFISELQQAKIHCLRFMDWGCVNSSLVTAWSQRIPKTANHYLSGNTQPQKGGTGYGVAYEWMIDLCNRVSADMWVCVPHQTDTNYAFQLATLIKNNLNSNLKVYVEYSNECWNDGFAQTGWLDSQKNIHGLANPLKWQGQNIYGFGSGGDCRWSEYVYFVCRTMNQFNQVFGKNSPRVVKVMSGQAGWGLGSGTNQVCQYHMACLLSPICNPWGVTIDAYAIAPYWNASDHAPTGTEASMRTGLADCVTELTDTRSALTGSSIPLVCYEAGPDNYSTQSIANASFQYQLTIDAFNALAPLVQGAFNYYTFNGGAMWGLKEQVGDDPSIAPKWRGYMQWLSTATVAKPIVSSISPVKHSGTPALFNLLGQHVHEAGSNRALRCNTHGVFIAVQDNAKTTHISVIR